MLPSAGGLLRSTVNGPPSPVESIKTRFRKKFGMTVYGYSENATFRHAEIIPVSRLRIVTSIPILETHNLHFATDSLLYPTPNPLSPTTVSSKPRSRNKFGMILNRRPQTGALNRDPKQEHFGAGFRAGSLGQVFMAGSLG